LPEYGAKAPNSKPHTGESAQKERVERFEGDSVAGL